MGRPTLSHKRTFSGGAGRQTREAELAHERLKLERADYERNRTSFNERMGSVMSQAQAPRKEWFDQNMSDVHLDAGEESRSQSKAA